MRGRELRPQLIFGLIYRFVVARFVWPLHLPLPAKIAAAAFLFVASQYLEWCRLSSGSRFSPEFPRMVVVLVNWAFGGLVFLALLQILLDAGLLIAVAFRGAVGVPDGVRYGMAALAAVAAATGVQQAVRVPPLKDVDVGIPGLPRQFDGYTLLHLTDLHISRLYTASTVGATPWSYRGAAGAAASDRGGAPYVWRGAAELSIASRPSPHLDILKARLRPAPHRRRAALVRRAHSYRLRL